MIGYDKSISSRHLLNTLNGHTPARTPLWMMRQAGRYLPEYMAVRKDHDTLTMFTTPSIASEITLQPLRRYDLDAAIVYADILLIPHALGLGLKFIKGEGPKFDRCVRTEDDVAFLEKQVATPQGLAAVVEKCSYLARTLELVKPQLAAHQTLIGFCGAPWTVASYMIEGGSADGEFFHSKLLMLRSPNLFQRLMKVVTDVSVEYLKMQIHAGAQALQIFESWGGALTPNQYQTHCAPHTSKLVEAIKTLVPVIHYVGESAGILDEAAKVPSQGFGVDWRQDLNVTRMHASLQNKTLQGNLDPLLLYAPQELLGEEVRKIVQAGKKHPAGYIFNLGHGIKQTTPLDSVGFLVDLVHSI
jgi:uroporphyrinogen decarboxylase